MEPQWICDNSFFVTCTGDYALKSQVLVGLPGGLRIVLDSRSVQTDNAPVWKQVPPKRKEKNCIRNRSKDRQQMH